MSAAITAPITIDAFKEWLSRQPIGGVVGYRGNPALCPIARYLRSATGDRWIVSQELATHANAMTELPLWAVWFVSNVDTADSPSFAVTVEEARDLADMARARFPD